MLYYGIAKLKHEMGATKKDEDEFFEKSKGYYYATIQLLQKYSRGSSVQNLRSSLVSVMLELQDRQEALKIAQESITLDAMNYQAYEILGQVFFTCEDFSNAVETWRQAIVRKNTTEVEINNPDLYMKLGRAYVSLAQSRQGICLNDQQCQDALHYLKHALKCCTDDHAQQRLQIYCALGYLHFTRGEYDQAIDYLRLTQSFRFAFYTSTFYLAYIYLRQKDYDAAFKQFHELKKQTKNLSGDPNDILEKENSGHICVNEMKALALWGQAYIHAERDINLEEGLRLAEHACILAEQVSTENLQFPSRYLHCKGWLLFKLDQLEPLEMSNGSAGHQTSTGKKAIEVLLQAAKREAQPEIYFHLAQACQARLSQISAVSEKQRLLANIRTYCQHARDLHADDTLRQQIDDLVKSLPPAHASLALYLS
jgi:tetratricopeptide (TPR) repeat protein